MTEQEPIDRKLLRHLSLSPVIVALLVMLGGPGLYFSLNYQYLNAEIEAISLIHGSLVNDAINKNPSMWQFEEHKLRALVEDRIEHDHAHNATRRRIILNDQTVLAVSEETLYKPVIQFSTPLYDASQQVGHFVVEASLRSLLNDTLWVALACLLVAVFILFGLRTIPLRAIRKSYQQLSYLANNDNLTGLANRHCFMAQLELAIAQARRSQTCVLLMFIDLDNFKHVNDSMGHHAGDELLSTLGKRLKDLTRSSDIAARIGGDEFVLCYTQLSGDIEAINRLACKVHERIIEPVILAQRHLKITSSIGLAKFPDDGSDATSLLLAADTAMYASKNSGKDAFNFYSHELCAQLKERLRIISDLPGAIKKQELEVYYQPLLKAETEELVGVEALVRWTHPELGPIPPNRLISIAEETGDIVQLGEWVLNRACQQNKTWQEEGYPSLFVAVNVSAVQFSHPEFLQSVDHALTLSGLAPGSLELEITESLIMENLDNAYEVMQEINRRGISLSIDDFGTGYSSLNHLKRFPASKLKIDRSFVQDLNKSGEDQMITKIIILLGKELGMQVVAEGVENTEQITFLRENNCDVVQGFHYSPPVPADEIYDFFNRDQCRQA